MNKIIYRLKLKPIRKSLPVSLRTTHDEYSYRIAKQRGGTVPLDSEQYLQEWDSWAIIKNAFPYSAAFKVHHMLIPKRRVTESELTKQERQELQEILEDLSGEYDCYLVNFLTKQSIRNHYHVHLLTYHDHRSQLPY